MSMYLSVIIKKIEILFIYIQKTIQKTIPISLTLTKLIKVKTSTLFF